MLHSHSYGEEGHSQLLETKVHNGKSARCVGFDHEGRDLYSAGADCLLHSMDADTGATKWRVEDAHEHPIHSMCKLEEGQAAPWLLATGDDQGVVKVWDTRQRKPAMWMSEQTDYVSGICEGNEGKSLLAVSADMTLAVLNLRSGKLEGRSDEQEDELLSISVLKGGRKIACGCQNGVILLWSWGRWGDCSDRIPGHPQSVDALVKVSYCLV
jgi:WD40 repeat protein